MPGGERFMIVWVRLYVMTGVLCFLARHVSTEPSWAASLRLPITAKTLSSSANAVQICTFRSLVLVSGQYILKSGTILRPLMPPFALMSLMYAW